MYAHLTIFSLEKIMTICQQKGIIIFYTNYICIHIFTTMRNLKSSQLSENFYYMFPNLIFNRMKSKLTLIPHLHQARTIKEKKQASDTVHVKPEPSVVPAKDPRFKAHSSEDAKNKTTPQESQAVLPRAPSPSPK